MAAIEEFLSARRNDGLLRELRPISARREGRVRIGAREYLDLSSNDYLGLAGHPRMAQAAKEALDEFGAGACASRLMGGDLDIFHRLEERVAKFKSTESALVFNSGYQANVGIFSALLGREDAAFCRPRQPRQHPGRHPPLRRAALPVPAQRSGASRIAPEEGARQVQGRADRDGNDLQHGRRPRAAARAR